MISTVWAIAATILFGENGFILLDCKREIALLSVAKSSHLLKIDQLLLGIFYAGYTDKRARTRDFQSPR